MNIVIQQKVVSENMANNQENGNVGESELGKSECEYLDQFH